MFLTDATPAAGRMHVHRAPREFLSRLRPGPRGRTRGALLLWALLTFGGLYLLQRARLGSLGHPIMTVVAGALLIALELWTTRRVEWTDATRARRARGLWAGAVAAGVMARLLALGVALYGLVEFPASLEADDSYIFYRGVIPHYWWLLSLALWLHPLAALGAGAAWLALVEALVVRRGWLRGVICLAVPGALLWGTLHAEYYYWFRQPRHDAVLSQSDVRLRFDTRSLDQERHRQTWLQSRDFFVDVDEDVLYASFGRTFGPGHNDDPNLWRIELGSGRFTQSTMPQVRALGGREHPTTLYACPFHTSEILRFDKASLDPRPGVDLRELWEHPTREPTDAIETGRHLIVAMNGVAALLKLDTELGRVVDRVSLTDTDAARVGDLCCRLLVDEPRGTLYVITGKPDHSVLTEVDLATLEPRRHEALPFIAQYMALGGAARGSIYLSSEFSRDLYRLDRETWEPRALGGVDPQARLAWDPVDDKLMILGFFDGTLTRADADGRAEQAWDVGPHPRALQITPDGYYTISGVGLVHITRPGSTLHPPKP
jgi:hypothetical protein